jgi:hypothetical protein
MAHLKYVLHILLGKFVLSKKQFYSCPHLGIPESLRHQAEMTSVTLDSQLKTSQDKQSNTSITYPECQMCPRISVINWNIQRLKLRRMVCKPNLPG